MDLEAELLAIITAFEQSSIDYALCGGLAVAIHGYARTTKDIDVLIRRDDVERAVAALATVGFTVDSGDIPFDAGTPKETRIRRISKAQGRELLTVDLLLVYPVYEDVWESAEVFEWRGREVTVVSAQGLAKMKRLSGRPKDLLDLQELGLDDETPKDH